MTTTLGQTYAASQAQPAAAPSRDGARRTRSGSRTHVRRSKRAVTTQAAGQRAGWIASAVMLGALAGVGLAAALLSGLGG